VSFAPRLAVTDALAAALTRAARARAFLDAARLSDGWLATMRARSMVREAYHATHIEGSRLTLEQAERIFSGDAVAEEPDDARELLNYRDVFAFTCATVDDGALLTEGLVRELHTRLLDGVKRGEGTGGEYRSEDGYVIKAMTRAVVYRPPAAAEVPRLVGELLAWLNGGEPEVHPVVAAGVAQFQLAHIHPFVHASGRTARLLATLCLHRAGHDFKGLLAISEHHDRNRTAFSRAMQRVRDAGMDLTGWLEFFAEGLATRADAVRSLVDQEIRRDVIARHGLTERQAAAVGHVREEGRLAIGDFERLCPGTPRRLLQRELKQLVDKGFLRRAGPANRPHYLAGDEPGT
jgi:Fic family protein